MGAPARFAAFTLAPRNLAEQNPLHRNDMIKSFIPIIGIALVLVGCSPHRPVEKGSLTIQPSAGWKIEHQPGEVESYMLTSTSGKGWFMLNQVGPPTRPEEFPAIVRKFVDAFVKQIKESAEFTLTDDKYVVEEFAGDHCKGSFATLRVRGEGTESLRITFMMSVDGQTWNGQFNGKVEQWPQVLKMLKSIKKNG